MILETILQDVRVGFRVLFREKAFFALAVCVLAIGICAVTTQFTVVDAIVLRGFTFSHPEQLVDISIGDPLTLSTRGAQVAMLDYEEAIRQQHSFSALSGYLNGSTVNTTIAGVPRRHTGGYVTDKFFSLLGVQPILGRDFAPADNKAGAARTLIISYDLWQSDFAGDPAVIGRAITVNGQMTTVIGVMPKGFRFPVSEELWVPLYSEFPPRPRDDPQALTVAVIGRLKPGVTLDQATAEFTTIARRLALENPKTNKLLTAAQVQPLIYNFIGVTIRRMLYGMLFAVGAVLLIACVNVMNMQLARATLRAKELAIRGALGASRGRLVRQMLTESLVVATVGAVLGVLMSEWALNFLTRATSQLSFPLPYWIKFTIDVPVLAFTVGVTVFSAVASGLLPALIISRANPASVLKEGGRGNSSRMINVITRTLVVAQIALTSALLVGCFLQIKSVTMQRELNFGYDERSVYSARMGLFQADYPSEAARTAFFGKVLRELRADPAIGQAALSTRFQMLFNFPQQVEVQGHVYPTDRDRPLINGEEISDDYFQTLGVPLLEGRGFTADDREDMHPVAIVNASLARQLFGREDPIGRQIRVFQAGGAVWHTVVGVAPDMHMAGPFPQNDGTFIEAGWYTPIAGSLAPQFATIIVRPRGGPAEALQEAIQRDVRRADPNLPLYFLGTPMQLHLAILGQNQIVSNMFIAFGAAALLLSAAGLYGVMSFSVNQRTLEFGIRMALGARPADIFGMVFRQGGLQLAIGMAIGLGCTVAAVLMADASQIAAIIPFVSPRDPLIYGTVIGTLAAVAAVSCFGPANRATRVPPMVALRSE